MGWRPPIDARRCVPKVLGADIELANFIVRAGGSGGGGSSDVAALAVLAEIDGVRSRRQLLPAAFTGSALVDPQDLDRRFLVTNAGCYYRDLDHAEACIPEVRSAADYVAAWHAMLRIAQAAQGRANARLGDDGQVMLIANNTDGVVSYGAHLNVLVSAEAWRAVVDERGPALAMLLAHQVSSIVYTGQGKIGAANGRPWTNYQISQRADFFECLLGEQTTHNRPLVNTRNEPLCGPRPPGERDLARMHVIFYDATLSQVSNFLKAGTMQLTLAMCEAGAIDESLELADPLAALHIWSRDPSLRTRARLADGTALTPVELQWRLFEDASRFVTGVDGIESIVPGAGRILEVWERTLGRLERRDLGALASQLDWVAKQMLIERLLDSRPGLDWDSAPARHLDLVYASLDTRTGPYWGLERAQAIETIVSAADIERLCHEPPSNTRAWTRAMLMRRLGPEAIERIDWDRAVIWLPGLEGPRRVTLDLGDPLGLTREIAEPVFVTAPTTPALIAGLQVAGYLDRMQPRAFAASSHVTN